MPSLRRMPAALAASSLAIVGLVAGCSAIADPADSPASPGTPTPPAATVAVAPDTVALTFELGGTMHTVIGAVGGGLRSCRESSILVAAEGTPDAGVNIFRDDDAPAETNVLAWAVGDYAVQFSGKGHVEAIDGGASYRAAQIAGWARVRAVDPGTDQRIAELDMAGGDQVDATVTFTVDCPAG